MISTRGCCRTVFPSLRSSKTAAKPGVIHTKKGENDEETTHFQNPGNGNPRLTGTLSCDGVLIPGVDDRLEKLSQQLHVTVLTADTFGKAANQLDPLPVDLHLIQTGRDKKVFMAGFKQSETAATGNGRSDVEMIRMAGLGIAVIGPEWL